MRCQKCGQWNWWTNKHCSRCGSQLTKLDAKQKGGMDKPQINFLNIITILAVVVIAVCLAVLFGPSSKIEGSGGTEPTERIAETVVVPTKETVHQHSWKDATCEDPQICKICGEKTGLPLGHKWLDATYDMPKTCKVCGEVSGDVKKNPFSGVKPGNTIRFGEYEQDNNTANGKEDIEWIVLDVQGNKALLISWYALDSRPYNNVDETITWEKCDLRNWLNTSFLKAAFTPQDQQLIRSTKVDNSISQGSRDWYTQGGNNTEDYVFLLSFAETETYFNGKEGRKCAPTAFAASKREGVTDVGVPDACWWWLRSPGRDQRQATFVNYDGTYYTNFVGNKYLSVRPAIWVNID